MFTFFNVKIIDYAWLPYISAIRKSITGVHISAGAINPYKTQWTLVVRDVSDLNTLTSWEYLS